MKKLSLLFGALGGAFAGYLFSNQKLRQELATAKDAESAAKLLGRHLQQDGKKLAAQVQDLVESDEVQKNIGKAKKYAQDTFVTARKELTRLVRKAEHASAGTAKTTARRAIRKAKTAARRFKAKVRSLA
ncbi:MAG: hypothetical protein PHS73_04485 [Candidatus Peribacteraceae bacterium]|nr:hypothetical protein [Candidatus Peribacteraceae bacterium]